MPRATGCNWFNINLSLAKIENAPSAEQSAGSCVAGESREWRQIRKLGYRLTKADGRSTESPAKVCHHSRDTNDWTSLGGKIVAMMQAAKARKRHDFGFSARTRSRAVVGCVLFQSKMRSVRMIVTNIFRQQSPQVTNLSASLYLDRSCLFPNWFCFPKFILPIRRLHFTLWNILA